METLRLAIAQINCTVGDLIGNTQKICDYIKRALEMEVDLLVFPEMAIPGYPPEDLLHKPHFIQDNLDYLQKVIRHTGDITVAVGFIDKKDDKIYNAVSIIHMNSICGVYHKVNLPNYSVFDEVRYFSSGSSYPIFIIKGINVGFNICEDIWKLNGPTKIESQTGNANLIVNISASPYHMEKWKSRINILKKQAINNSVIVVYANMVGGQDELVFDGHSMIFDQEGNLIKQGKQFKEELIITDLEIKKPKLSFLKKLKNFRIERIIISKTPSSRKKYPAPETEYIPLDTHEEVYNALILGTKDYVLKNNFKKVIIGLSGGIDSALTCVVAVDALGCENVLGVFMPSLFSSIESHNDARKLANNLNIKLTIIPIQKIFISYLSTLKKEFKDFPFGIAEENIQARIRGNILMALSNKFGYLVLTTGNKSEASVGYATLYGDTAGGFAVIKDVPKTLIYDLLEYRNKKAEFPIIPKNILTKEPTAELRENQKDRDSLPPYSSLDPILKLYVEEDKSFDEIISKGFDKEMVLNITNMVDKNEYKRRQSPPGVKVTPKIFGKDRRMPITNKYKLKYD
ncbi:MAG: NAD+ synthase [bacterium]|nr:NAD+ synthase [bacterium]